MKTALVIGPYGVVGSSLVAYLQSEPDWRVIGVSRRGGQDGPAVRFLAVDLLDSRQTQAALAALTDVTHVFYAGYQERPTPAESVGPNLAMLTNVVDGIEPVARQLAHISIMQGLRVYGGHLGPFKTPARESDGGHMPPEFNIDQQDFLAARQRQAGWTWSAMRPSVVGGVAVGNPMNLAVAIGVFATMSRELGVPLRFPGKPGAYHSLMQMTDSRLLAKAAVWAATDPNGACQVFNVGNGDLFRWSELWPRIGEYFSVDVAPPLPMSLTETMTDKAELWSAMALKYGLSPSYEEVSNWPVADHVWAYDYDFFADNSKIRQAGFHETIDTETMFVELFDELRGRRVLP